MGWTIVGIERLGHHFAVSFLQQNLYAAFGFFQLLLTLTRKSDAFFKEFHGLVEGKIGAFHAFHDFFKPRERFFEIVLARRLCRCWFVRHWIHSSSSRCAKSAF